MNTDRYSADRAIPEAPLLTPTHLAIAALWHALRYTPYAERVCLRQYRQADGRPVGYLAQLTEPQGQNLLAYLQTRQAADAALAAKDGPP